MTEPEFTLNEFQLELFYNAKTYLLLETFTKAMNPSDAAKKLGVPANRVHYHVKRLAAAGLLQVVSETGRRRVYKTVATKFRFRKDLLEPVADALTAGGADLLGGLKDGFTTAFEQFFETARGEADEDSSDYGLLDLGTGQPQRAYQPLLGMTELRLSRKGYAQVVEAMMTALHAAEKTNAGEAEKRSAGKPCTVAVVVYQGRAVPR